MSAKRYDGLDVLRAGLMTSVIMAHAGLNYSSKLSAGWGNFHDPHNNHIVFYYIILIWNLFSMPVFYVLAGFFAATTASLSSVGDMLRSRTQRILLPLIVFMLLLSPIVMLGFRAGATGSTSSPEFQALLNDTLSGRPIILLMHLWFLYYLFICCAGAYVVVKLSQRLPAAWISRVVQVLDGWITSPRYTLIFGLITFVTLSTMYGPWFETPALLIPSWRIILVESVFFLFGWRLYFHKSMLDRFMKNPLTNIAISLLFLGGYFVFFFNFDWFPHYRLHTMAAMFMGAFFIWFMVPGLIGLSLKTFTNPSNFVKLLAQASYWMYLIHMPLTIWLAYWTLDWQAPAFVKFGVNLFTVFSASFLSYLLFVRSSFIGKFLNGKTYPWFFGRRKTTLKPVTNPTT